MAEQPSWRLCLHDLRTLSRGYGDYSYVVKIGMAMSMQELLLWQAAGVSVKKVSLSMKNVEPRTDGM